MSQKTLTIPKKIHYCWFGGNEMPYHLKYCLKTWKSVMPDYEIIRWDENNFDIDMIQFTSEAAREKKWAFLSDYARLYILNNEGGIYLDTDIVVRKRFDIFLNNNFFSSIQIYPNIVKEERTYELINEDGTVKNQDIFKEGVPGIGINTAVLGVIPNHPFVKDCMEIYNKIPFILKQGNFNIKVNNAIGAEVAYNYGFRFKNSLQKLSNMTFYPSELFACIRKQFTKESFTFHFADNSWQTQSFLEKISWKLLRTQPFMWFYLKNYQEPNK